jgi:hypothetical protein
MLVTDKASFLKEGDAMEPRDYGPFPYTPIKDRPKLEWPGGARVAVWVIPNIDSSPENRRQKEFNNRRKVQAARRSTIC